MPCYAPATAFYAAEPGPSGKRALVFKKDQSLSGAPVRIPCGQCIGCRLDKARETTVRLLHEQKLHKSSAFLTLTYRPDKMPTSGTLSKYDLQTFLKRLRKNHNIEGLRYYAVGEYGTQLQRPHYHVLLLNYDFVDKKIWQPAKRENDYLYRSEALEKLWTFGHSSIGTVTKESISYVARYVTKKITGPQADLHYSGKLPEFSLQSLKPGLGHGYFVKYGAEMLAHDNIILDGHPQPYPRYYEKLLSKSHETTIDKHKKTRKKRARLYRADNTYARRMVREKIAIITLEHKKERKT